MPRLSEQIRDVARGSALSQSELARRLDVDRATISRFINGVGGLSQEKLDQLAALLGLGVVKRSERLTPVSGALQGAPRKRPRR